MQIISNLDALVILKCFKNKKYKKNVQTEIADNSP